MRILVAEDEPITLRMIALRLERDGHEVITAGNCRDALQKIESLLPDLVITDIMMPFGSGLELIGQIRKLDKRIPVIILSSMGQEDVVVQAFRLGADDYMTKPFSFEELSVRVNRLVHVQRNLIGQSVLC